jgi:hypothetical protein
MNELENEMIAQLRLFLEGPRLVWIQIQSGKVYQENSIFAVHNFIQIDLLCEWRKNLHRILCVLLHFFARQPLFRGTQLVSRFTAYK